jgi:hypothetical protein
MLLRNALADPGRYGCRISERIIWSSIDPGDSGILRLIEGEDRAQASLFPERRVDHARLDNMVRLVEG